uniref:Uncharacterized protein n=1 Tax=Romanomermis culicivorax TaxID=13658 RepID=A0A915K994_ROMCU
MLWEMMIRREIVMKEELRHVGQSTEFHREEVADFLKVCGRLRLKEPIIIAVLFSLLFAASPFSSADVFRSFDGEFGDFCSLLLTIFLLN